MRFAVFIGFLVGVTLMVAVARAFPLAMLGEAVSRSTVPVACTSAWRFVSLGLYAQSWRALLPATRPRFATLLRLRWIGEAVNSLLPVAQVGGDMARARLLTARGVPGGDAAASMLADLGIGVASQLLFLVAGLVALTRAHPVLPVAGPSTWALVALCGAGLGLLALVAFGLGPLARWRPGAPRVATWTSTSTSTSTSAAAWTSRWTARRRTLRTAWHARWSAVGRGVARLEAAAQALRRRPRALIVATLWHLLGWLSQVAETWFVLWLVGARVSVLAALAIESLATTARGAAFFVPSGLGVQEGAVLALARALGVAPEPALALAVVKRLRELAVGAPGLIAWAVAEWRLPARLKAAAVLLPPTAPSTRKVTTDA